MCTIVSIADRVLTLYHCFINCRECTNIVSILYQLPLVNQAAMRTVVDVRVEIRYVQPPRCILASPAEQL